MTGVQTCALPILFSSKAFLLQILPVDEGFWVSDAEGGICMLNKSGKTLKKFDFSKSGKAVFKLVRAEDGSIWACQDANEELIRITPDFNVETLRQEARIVVTIHFAGRFI